MGKWGNVHCAVKEQNHAADEEEASCCAPPPSGCLAILPLGADDFDLLRRFWVRVGRWAWEGKRGGDRTYRLNRRLRQPLDGGGSQLGSCCGRRAGRDLLCVSDSHRVGMVLFVG